MNILFILFTLLVLASMIYAVNTFHAWQAFKGMIVLLIIGIAIPVVLDNTKKIKDFLTGWIFIYLILSIYVILHNGRGPGGSIGDENDAALAINMIIPIIISMTAIKSITKQKKVLLYITLTTCIAAVIATSSRGGFLGLAATFFGFFMLSENKARLILRTVALAIALSYPAYKLIPNEYMDEVASITDPEDSTRNARLHAWGLAWDMYLDNPLLGVGAQNYGWTVHNYQLRRKDFNPEDERLLGGRAAHSLYFTLIAELGTTGLILYAMMISSMIKGLLPLVRQHPGKNETDNDSAIIAKGLIVALFSYSVTAVFISVLYYPTFWYLYSITHALLNSELHAENDTAKTMQRD